MREYVVNVLIAFAVLALFAAGGYARETDHGPATDSAPRGPGRLTALRAPATHGGAAHANSTGRREADPGVASWDAWPAGTAQCPTPGTKARLALREPADVAAWRATFALDEARSELRAGLEPGPGELLGVARGQPRLAHAFWNRMHRLEQAVRDARRDLDATEAECHRLG